MGSPTVFEAEAGYGNRKATQFKIKSVEQIYEDFLWIRYQVIKDQTTER
jgi:hypothetical protein